MSKKLYAVIHAHDRVHGLRNAHLAMASGAYGVALIDQYCTGDEVEAMAHELRVGHHACRAADKILINILGSNEQAFALATKYRCGAWIDSFDCDDKNIANAIYQGVPVLGGIRFKYQHETDLMAGWKLRRGLHGFGQGGGLIPMISGKGTGLAPADHWVDQVRRLIGPVPPLAIASGIAAENIVRFLPLASHFLVGTSIETTEHEIVTDRVRAIESIISAYEASRP